MLTKLTLAALSLIIFVSSNLYAQNAQTLEAGSLKLNNGSGGTLLILPPPSGTASFSLPTNTPSSGNVLTSTGGTGTSWQPAATTFTPNMSYYFTGGTIARMGTGGTDIAFFSIGFVSGDISTDNTHFTIHTAGAYRVDFSLSIANPQTDICDFLVYKNGSPASTDFEIGASFSGFLVGTTTGFAIIQCAAGDVITIHDATSPDNPIYNGAVIINRVL